MHSQIFMARAGSFGRYGWSLADGSLDACCRKFPVGNHTESRGDLGHCPANALNLSEHGHAERV